MINGESYKIIVAEAAKNRLGDVGNIFERVFIVGPPDGRRQRICAGAYGFSVRENKFYVFKAKATLVASMGGAVARLQAAFSSGEGAGRAWYPPFNSGASTRTSRCRPAPR